MWSYRRRLGRALVERYGKERTYSVNQVRVTAEKVGLDVEYIDYAYAAYCGRKLYEEHHTSLGEVCNWAAVRAEVGRVHGVSGSSGPRHDSDTWAASPYSFGDDDGGGHQDGGGHHH